VVFVAHATHSNAALTPRARLRLARLIVDHGWLIPWAGTLSCQANRDAIRDRKY
jgi:hypothetical protein